MSCEIDERVRKQDRMPEQSRLQIDRLPLAYISLDVDNCVVDWNSTAESIFGYTKDEVLGREVVGLILPHPMNDQLRAVLHRIRAGDMEAHSINENRTKDGRLIICEWFNTPLISADGTYAGVIALAKDITDQRHAEERLRESEERFRQLAENIDGYVWLSSPDDNQMFYISRGYEKISGRTCESMYERPDSWIEIIQPEDRERVLATVRQPLSDGGRQVEYRIVRPDGAVRWIRDRAFPVRDASGEVCRVAGIGEDITERKRAEQALQNNEEKIRLLLNSTGEAIFGIDLEGRCTFCNSACLRLLRYSDQQELLGKIMHGLIHHTREDGSPYRREDCPATRALKLGEPTHAQHEILWRADLTSFHAEYWSHPVRHGNDILGAVITFVDTSERKRVEEEMRTLNAALENAVEGIARLDTEGNYLTVNRAYADMLGYKPEELISGSWRQTVHPDDRQQVEAAYQRMLRQERVESEVRAIRKDSSVFWKQLMMVKAYDQQGQWSGHYCFMKDISERKQAEDALRQFAVRLQDLSRRVVEVQEQERRHLARELHDEIGQILSTISVTLQANMKSCNCDSKTRLEDSIGIVNTAIHQVHDLSLDLRPSMLDDLGLVPTLRWCADRQAQRAGFELSFMVESSGARLPSDLEIACYRIAQEVLTNVVRHSQARHVRVELRQQEDDVQLLIRDDGIGFNLDAVRRGAARGASYGVLGMEERVELLGGQIEITSKPGHGTCIHVSFPLSAQPTHAAEPKARH